MSAVETVVGAPRRRTAISVVIPCYNAAATLPATLTALARSSLQPLEVLCADDGSDDDTVATVALLASESVVPIRLLPGPGRQGPAAARNRGAAEARGELLLFIDADVVVARGALAAMHRRLAAGWSAVVATHADISLQPGALAHFQAALLHDVFRSVDADDSPYLGTNCVLLRRAAFDAVGGFDASFRAATVEDFAFGHQLRALHHRLAVAPDAIVYHNHHYTLRSFTRNYFRKARDLVRLEGLPRPGAATAVGYTSASNVGAGAASVGVAAATVGAIAGVARVPLLAVAVLAAASLLVRWRPFLGRARVHAGRTRWVTFAVLRWWVSVVGVAGGLRGLVTAGGRPRGLQSPGGIAEVASRPAT